MLELWETPLLATGSPAATPPAGGWHQAGLLASWSSPPSGSKNAASEFSVVPQDVQVDIRGARRHAPRAYALPVRTPHGADAGRSPRHKTGLLYSNGYFRVLLDRAGCNGAAVAPTAEVLARCRTLLCPSFAAGNYARGYCDTVLCPNICTPAVTGLQVRANASIYVSVWNVGSTALDATNFTYQARRSAKQRGCCTHADALPRSRSSPQAARRW